MSESQKKQTTLTIHQQNTNRSETATWSMINTTNLKNTDIIAVQEPYFDFLKHTRATTGHLKDQAERS